MSEDFYAEYDRQSREWERISRFWREFGIRTRGANALAYGGITTVEELTAKTADELLALNQFGKLCLSDVIYELGERGLALAEVVKTPQYKTMAWQIGVAAVLRDLGWECTPPKTP